MKEYAKAVRHDTLRAVENAEHLVASLGDGEGEGTHKLRSNQALRQASQGGTGGLGRQV